MQTPDMLHQHYLATMGPLFAITITAFVVMILEFATGKGNRRWLTGLSMIGTIVALVISLVHFRAPAQMTLFAVISDGLATVFSVLILITALLVLLFSYDYQTKKHLPAEHTYLILFGVAGALTMVSAIDLITLYVGLELLSVASYVLVAVRRKSLRSVEGGVKYLIIGSIGSAVMLYGMSFIYGISGNTFLYAIGQNSGAMWTAYPGITILAFVLILAGLGVKLSLVPFHMWTPDAYDGAPSPVSAFLATLSKTASFVMLLRLLLYIFNGATGTVFYWAGILAIITMVVGNLLALPQQNMKRLLAFSSVAQAGYVLIPIALLGTSQTYDWPALYDNLAFYLFGYTFMTVGAFAVVHVVATERQSSHTDALSGLWKRSPWLAAALCVFLLSLAGMPLTAGFVGKFYIFTSTLHLHQMWLGIILFATSVISFYYYFGLIRKMFQSQPVDDVARPLRTSAAMHALLGLCVAGTLVLGLVPAALLHPLLSVSWF